MSRPALFLRHLTMDRLAGTAACATQMFAKGASTSGRQFHPEAGGLPGVECWIIGHSLEPVQVAIAFASQRSHARPDCPSPDHAVQPMLRAWLRELPS